MFIYNKTCACTIAEDEEQLALEIETEVFDENFQTQNIKVININTEDIYPNGRAENDERPYEEIFEGNPWTRFSPEQTPDTIEFKMEVFSESSERSDSHTFEEIKRSEFKSSESPDFEMIQHEIDSHEENSDLGHDTNKIEDRENKSDSNSSTTSFHSSFAVISEDDLEDFEVL